MAAGVFSLEGCDQARSLIGDRSAICVSDTTTSNVAKIIDAFAQPFAKGHVSPSLKLTDVLLVDYNADTKRALCSAQATFDGISPALKANPVFAGMATFQLRYAIQPLANGTDLHYEIVGPSNEVLMQALTVALLPSDQLLPAAAPPENVAAPQPASQGDEGTNTIAEGNSESSAANTSN